MNDVERINNVVNKREKYDALTYKIIGAAMKVHNALGKGFAEVVYADALEREFVCLNIPYFREKEIDIIYDGNPLKHKFRADFICYDNIIIELKATSDIVKGHHSQIINYLKATGYECGVLLNFGRDRLGTERFFN